jgi:hypothetical protein
MPNALPQRTDPETLRMQRELIDFLQDFMVGDEYE